VISVTIPEDPYFICGDNSGILTITLPPATNYDSVQWFDDSVQVVGFSGLTCTLNKWDVGNFHAHIWFNGQFYSTATVNVNHFHIQTNDERICLNQRAHCMAPTFASAARYEWILGQLTDPTVQDMTGNGTGANGGPDFYASPLGYDGNIWCKIIYNGCTNYSKVRIIATDCAPAPRPMDRMDDASSTSSVYPNPSNGNFTLSLVGLNAGMPVQIQVMDIAGRSVYQNTVQASGAAETIQIDAELSTGIYAVKATQEGFNFASRAVVK
jgi:hypothetical protein